MRLVVGLVVVALIALPSAATAAPDRDGDGLPNRWEARFNLPAGKAGGARGDPDADGVRNLKEYRRRCNPRRADTDRDGMPDAFEVRHRLKCRNRRDAGRDSDLDLLTNLTEFQLGTNPRRPDSDGDGLLDGADNCPLAINRGQENSYGDARGDACEPPPLVEPQPPDPGAQPSPRVDLAVTKAADKDSAEPTDEVVYTVTVRNLGPEGAPAVELIDQLPLTPQPDGEFGPREPHRDVVATGRPTTSQGSCTTVNASTNRFICSLGTVAPGGVVTIQLTVRVECAIDSTGQIVNSKSVTNTASASTPASDIDGSNNTGQKAITVTNTCA